MPRYALTVQNSKPEPDRVEVDIRRPHEARVMAMAEASQMLRDHQDMAWLSPNWWVHAIDRTGALVCCLTVSGRTEG